MIQDTAIKEKFLQDGYVILPGVVPADQLESQRNAYEQIVARARRHDATWYTTAAARANVVPYLDKDTVGTLEFALQETPFGVSAQVLDCEAQKLALTSVSVLCNPEFEPTETPTSGQSWGTDPRNWHRDIRPDHDGPLDALLADQEANGPGYAQWNIALHEDSVFYVIPGSHRRLTSEVEAMQLQSEGGTQAPLSGCVCVELQPGDGVVYNNMLLHWGSKYTQHKKRRTIHLGYRTFGNILPHQRECRLPESVSELLPANSPQRRSLENGFALFRREYALLREIFCAVAADDVARFQAGLALLHPNSAGRLACLIVLSKIAKNVFSLRQEIEAGAHRSAAAEGVALQQQLDSELTTAEVEKLWKRFSVLDDMLRSDETTHVGGFLGPSTDYLFAEPSWMTVEGVLAAMFERSP